MSNFYLIRLQFAGFKKILLAIVFLSLCCARTAKAQINAGDIAFVGYSTTDNMTGTAVINDSFSFIALTDIPNGTVIYFTDFGWRSDAAAFATACSGSTGAVTDGAISWTANQLVATGTIVWVSCRAAPLASNYGSVAGVIATSGSATDYMSLATQGDQIIAYTGTFASPTLITAIQINKAAWDVSYTSCEISSTKSTLPSALSSNSLAFLTATTTGRQGYFNCNALAGTAAQKRAIIYDASHWTFDNSGVPSSGPLGNFVSHCIPAANAAPVFTRGTSQSLTICQDAPATSINTLLTVNDADAGQTETWTVSGTPSHGSVVTGATHASGTGVSPTGFTYQPTSGYSGSDAFTIQVSDGAGGTASTTINVTINQNRVVSAGSAVSAVCQGATTATLGGSIGGSANSAVWSDGGAGGSFTNNGGSTPNTTTYTASASSPASVTLTLTASGGSCGPTTDSKLLTVNENRIVSAGGAVTAICQGGTTAALGGSIGGSATSGIWSDGGAGGSFTNNGGSTPNTTTYTASASAPASVSLTLIASGGVCGPTTAGKSVTVNQARIVSAGSAVSGICQGATTSALGGSFGGSATSAIWSDGGAGGSFSGNGGSDPANASYTSSLSAPTSVTLTLTASGGSCGPTTDSKILSVTQPRTVSAGGAVAAVCQGGTTAALGGSFGGSATAAVWSDGGAGGSFTGNGGSDPANATYTASASSPASVTLTLTASGGSCGPTTAGKSLTVNEARIVSAGSATGAICQGGTTAALGGSFGGSATSAVWSDGGAGGSFTNNGGGTPNSATYTASASAPASVTLTLTASGGSCGPTTASKILTVNATTTVDVGGAVAAICQGGTTAALGGSFGGSAATAIWDDGGAGGSFANNTGTTPGLATYTASSGSSSPVTLTLSTAGGSCGTPVASKTLVVNQARILNAGGAVSAICQGATTAVLGGSFGGSATAAVWDDGGAGGTFTGNGGADPANATYTASATSPAIVTLTLTASGGLCGPTTGSKTLTVNPNPTVSAGGALSAICQGGTTAALSGTFGGGATLATWSDNGAGGSFTNNSGSDPSVTTYTASSSALTTVTLTLTTSGGSCGTSSASKPLTVNPNPIVNAGPALSAICQGGTTTILGGSFGGGATAAIWNDGGAGGSFTNNGGSDPSATTYTASSSSSTPVTLTLLTSGGSCGTTSANKSLTVNPTSTVNAGGALSAICQGGTTAALGGTFGGGATSAIWSDNGGGGSFTNNAGTDPSVTTYTASSSAMTTVTLTLTTSGGSCGALTASKPLTVNQNPTAGAGAAVTAICQGGTTAALGGSFGGSATSAIWSDGGAGGTFTNNGGTTPATTTYTASAFSSSPVTLTLTTSGGLCGILTPNKSLTVNPTPVIGSINNDGPTCAGLTLNLTSSASGGTGTLSYAWSGPASYSSTLRNPSIPSVATSADGTYSLSVTDINSCQADGTTTAVIRPTPAIVAISNNAPVCEEKTLTLSSSVTGGTSVYTFEWNGPNGFTSADEDPTVTTSATTAADGIYTLVVTDANGCVATGANTTAVTVHPIQPIVGATSVLFGQTITLSDPVTGGSWSTPTPWTTSVTSSGGVVKGVSAGTSIISYTTAHGCVATYTVSVISGINACVGQTITLSDNGIPGGTWSSGAASIATINTTTGVLKGVSAGKVVITYRTSPTASVTTTVTVNPLLPTSMSATIACQGQAITLTNTTAGGGTWYSGNTSIAVVSATGAVSGLSGGVVDIYFTPVAGCVTVKTLTITPVSPIIGATSVCVSSTISLSNETAGGTWYSSSGSLATVTVGGGVVYGVASGKPTIFYIWPNGCWASSTITVNPLVQSTTTTTGTVCQGASIAYSNTTLGGGVWTTGNTNVATVNSTGTVTGAGSGSSSVIFTTPAGCVSTKTVTVNGAPTLSGNTTVCMGQTTQLSSSATTGFWSSSSGAQATVSASGLVKGIASGSPRISYIMPTGCNSTVTVTVNTLNGTTGGTPSMCASGSMTLANSTPFGGVWTSSNTSIATVNSAGVVRGAGVGSVTISFTSTVGSCVATRTVTVNACRRADPTAVAATEEVLTELRLFPNPNNGAFTLQGTFEINEDKEAELEVMNMVGQVVYRGLVKTYDRKIDERIDIGNGLADGAYLLRVRSENNSKVFHFIVRH